MFHSQPVPISTTHRHPTRGPCCQMGWGRSHLTLLMAFRARLAALYRSGWPCVFRQSVCGTEQPGSMRALHGADSESVGAAHPGE